MDVWLSMTRLAEALGVAAITVARWVDGGVLQPGIDYLVLPGGRKRFNARTVVERFGGVFDPAQYEVRPVRRRQRCEHESAVSCPGGPRRRHGPAGVPGILPRV